MKNRTETHRSQITFVRRDGLYVQGSGWSGRSSRFCPTPTYETIVIRGLVFPAVLQVGHEPCAGRLFGLASSWIVLSMPNGYGCGVCETLLRPAWLLVASTTLMLHQRQLHDMTFVTSWGFLAFALWFLDCGWKSTHPNRSR